MITQLELQTPFILQRKQLSIYTKLYSIPSLNAFIHSKTPPYSPPT